MYETCLDVAIRVNDKAKMDWAEFLGYHKCVRNSLKMAETRRAGGMTGQEPATLWYNTQ